MAKYGIETFGVLSRAPGVPSEPNAWGPDSAKLAEIGVKKIDSVMPDHGLRSKETGELMAVKLEALELEGRTLFFSHLGESYASQKEACQNGLIHGSQVMLARVREFRECYPMVRFSGYTGIGVHASTLTPADQDVACELYSKLARECQKEGFVLVLEMSCVNPLVLGRLIAATRGTGRKISFDFANYFVYGLGQPAELLPILDSLIDSGDLSPEEVDFHAKDVRGKFNPKDPWNGYQLIAPGQEGSLINWSPIIEWVHRRQRADALFIEHEPQATGVLGEDVKEVQIDDIKNAASFLGTQLQRVGAN